MQILPFTHQQEQPTHVRLPSLYLVLLCFLHLLLFSSFSSIWSVSATNTVGNGVNTRAEKEGTLNLLVVGDWGSANHPLYSLTQRAVAQQMERTASSNGVSYVVGVGDNFYEEGVSSVDDRHFTESFVNMYSGELLQSLRWFQILGNHDYQGDINSQIQYHKDPRWYMPNPWYKISLAITPAINFTILFLDTTPMISGYFTHPQNQKMAQQLPLQNVQAQLTWLKEELKEASTKRPDDWLVVVGHHPLGSNSPWSDEEGRHYGGYVDLRSRLIPLLAQYKVPLYICGHDHDLQHLKEGAIDYLISGAASRVRLEPRRSVPSGSSVTPKFYAPQAGFMLLRINSNYLIAEIINSKGDIIYSTVVPKYNQPDDNNNNPNNNNNSSENDKIENKGMGTFLDLNFVVLLTVVGIFTFSIFGVIASIRLARVVRSWRHISKQQQLQQQPLVQQPEEEDVVGSSSADAINNDADIEMESFVGEQQTQQQKEENPNAGNDDGDDDVELQKKKVDKDKRE